MANLASHDLLPTADEREQMHALYLAEGEKRSMAPHVVYRDPSCPHGCGANLQAIDFRLEDHGKSVHDPLVRSWWADTGFAGRCPNCRKWIHFTVRSKRAISDDEAAELPQLPDDWSTKATIL